MIRECSHVFLYRCATDAAIEVQQQVNVSEQATRNVIRETSI